MHYHAKVDWTLPESAVTPEALFLNRRAMVTGMAAAGLLPAAAKASTEVAKLSPLSSRRTIATDEEPTALKAVTSYNNFYEYGLGKEDPARNAETLRPTPWTVKIGGLVAKPQTIDVDKLIAAASLEERIYRLRCVEGWSMVIPWLGIPLAGLVRAAQPLSSAKYIRFTTLADPKQMPGLRSNVLDWPYREGLRLDEAIHPLSFLAVGLYGRRLPNQNGAPIRLVVPWKYGFKSVKSIVAIDFVENQPLTSWNQSAPREYGFFSNVNPDVDHPRWSQATERRIGEFRKRPTLMFNGYPEVASLYRGMNLTRHY